VEIIEQLAAQKLEAAAQILAAEQKLAFVTPVLATHVPYDMECQLYEYHPALRGRVRQCGVNSGVAIGLHFQAALGVICSG
jgi:hypothetical protein